MCKLEFLLLAKQYLCRFKKSQQLKEEIARQRLEKEKKKTDTLKQQIELLKLQKETKIKEQQANKNEEVKLQNPQVNYPYYGYPQMQPPVYPHPYFPSPPPQQSMNDQNQVLSSLLQQLNKPKTEDNTTFEKQLLQKLDAIEAENKKLQKKTKKLLRQQREQEQNSQVVNSPGPFGPQSPMMPPMMNPYAFIPNMMNQFMPERKLHLCNIFN